jgi:hypothetical protein
MNFRLFIYYCALCGGWAALVGWVFAHNVSLEENPVATNGLKGLALGVFVTLALSTVDAFWNLPLRQFGEGLLRVLVAVMVGSAGGMFGGMLGQLLYGWKSLDMFLIFGWTLTGLLIGASIGIFEALVRFMNHQELGTALRKIINGTLGGMFGGFLGGFVLLFLTSAFGKVFSQKPPEVLEHLWVPSAAGYVALGMCIGLLIGLAQIIFKEAWVKIEVGRRAGREMLLSKPETSIGRAEACDIGLFGDPAVERMHARIVRQNQRYLLLDDGTPGGTYLNGVRIIGPTPLQANDLIQVGKCQLRFGERQKR